MAIFGLIADTRNWQVPANVWLAASAVMFLWAILRAFHDVRVERDEAMDVRDYQRIADRLTLMYQEGIAILDSIPSEGSQAFGKWNNESERWHKQVIQVLNEEACTVQDKNHFETIAQGDWYQEHDESAVIITRLMRIQIERIASISTKYANLAETLRVSTRKKRS